MRVGLGFFCSTSDNKLSTNHKLRLSKLNEDSLFNVFERNLSDFVKLLGLSRKMGLSIFRLGSNFIPFASHPRFRRDWLARIEMTIRDASPLIKSYGVRITMHPGQYVVLNSDNPGVIERSLRELEYHFWVLDTLGLGPESVVVVHAGGVYGDKQRATRRLYETLEENRWLLRRIALENDERYYTVLDVLEIGEAFNVPVVYDHLHHKLNPSAFSVDRLVATWKGVPLEIHVSSENGRARRPGEHGDYVRVEDFVEAISLFPGGVSIDTIIEAKKKERAVAKLIKDLKDRYPGLLSVVKASYEVELLEVGSSGHVLQP